MTRRVGLFAAAFLALGGLCAPHVTMAQTASAVVVPTCGTPPVTYSAGYPYPITQDTTGAQCSTASGGSVTPVPSPTLGGITPVVSSAAEACHVLKAAAGNLYSVSGYAGVAAWIMVFNATSAPADGAVTPIIWAYVPVAGSWSINYSTFPAAFSTGITVCASSTGPLTKTAVSTNNVFSGNVQ